MLYVCVCVCLSVCLLVSLSSLLSGLAFTNHIKLLSQIELHLCYLIYSIPWMFNIYFFVSRFRFFFCSLSDHFSLSLFYSFQILLALLLFATRCRWYYTSSMTFYPRLHLSTLNNITYIGCGAVINLAAYKDHAAECKAKLAKVRTISLSYDTPFNSEPKIACHMPMTHICCVRHYSIIIIYWMRVCFVCVRACIRNKWVMHCQ